MPEVHRRTFQLKALGASPLRVAPGCWMVGHRNATSLLQCNTYLRIVERGDSPLRICVDPGSQFDFSVVEGNVQQLVGDLGEVDVITLNHQDPDVVGNAGAFCEANRHINLWVTEDTWRLAQHLLLKPGKIAFANAARSDRIKLGNGRTWQAVATPFCHFRGAMAFYDPEIRTLFSGDLFGGLNQLGRVHLFAEEPDWEGIAQFHQIYMPSREVLRHAVRQILALDPPVEIIAPQHGYVIAGDRVRNFLDRMHELVVGYDLLVFEWEEKYLEQNRQVIAETIHWAMELMDETEVMSRLRATDCDDGLERLLQFSGKDVKLTGQGYSALVKVCARLGEGEIADFVNALRSFVLGLCSQRSLPVPPIGVGVEGREEG